MSAKEDPDRRWLLAVSAAAEAGDEGSQGVISMRVRTALRLSGGSRTEAARYLKVTPRSLRRWLAKPWMASVVDEFPRRDGRPWESTSA